MTYSLDKNGRQNEKPIRMGLGGIGLDFKVQGNSALNSINLLITPPHLFLMARTKTIHYVVSPRV